MYFTLKGSLPSLADFILSYSSQPSYTKRPQLLHLCRSGRSGTATQRTARLDSPRLALPAGHVRAPVWSRVARCQFRAKGVLISAHPRCSPSSPSYPSI